MPDRWLTITYPDGREYGVLPKDFDKLHETYYAGAKAVWADTGEDYERARAASHTAAKAKAKK